MKRFRSTTFIAAMYLFAGVASFVAVVGSWGDWTEVGVHVGLGIGCLLIARSLVGRPDATRSAALKVLLTVGAIMVLLRGLRWLG